MKRAIVTLVLLLVVGVCIVRYPTPPPNGDAGRIPAEANQWYSSPEWFLVIVGIGTALVVGWQSFETRRAANAALASIKLQEAEMIQWTTTKNWTAFTSVRDDGSKELHVSFDVFNPTRFPLVIEKTEMGCRGIIYSSNERASLPPEESYLMVLSSTLTEEEYALQILSVGIRATVSFSDVLKKPQEQTFAGFVKVDKNGETTFHPQAWWVQGYEETKWWSQEKCSGAALPLV